MASTTLPPTLCPEQSSFLGADYAPEHVQYYSTFYEYESTDTKQPKAADGYSLYRALARQIIGDPQRFSDIRDQVLHFSFRARSNPQHPLHQHYMDREAMFCRVNPRPLFAILDCPDLDPADEVLWVVAHALKIHIKVFTTISPLGKLDDCIGTAGTKGMPQCLVLRTKSKKGMAAHFCSLLPDESGRALVEWLQAQRQISKQQQQTESAVVSPSGPKVKQISWAWHPATTNGSSLPTVTCYNQYKRNSALASLGSHDRLWRMDTFVITVNDPLQIRPALDMLKEALKRAPNQSRNVKASEDRRGRIMRPYIAADFEFVKMPRERAANCADTRSAIDYGHLERLCSVLTLAVGRHFFLLFNIVHMLETANEHTVPALEALYREVIFNPELVKLWWNPQSDFGVMSATIAHMYQATERPSYKSHIKTAVYDDWDRRSWEYETITVTPTWRVTSPYFDGTRPDDLMGYTKVVECDLHQSTDRSRDYRGCPCAFGNIDMAALINNFCRQHGLEVFKQEWTGVRARFNYGDLMSTMLGTDRLSGLLQWIKGRGGYGEFYQGLGKPGMELDDDAMAYNIGDVAGQNLIFEQLIVSQDKRFIGGALHAYHKGTANRDGVRCLQVPISPARTVEQRLHGSCGDVHLVLDNPRTFKLMPFNTTPLKPRSYLRSKEKRDTLADAFLHSSAHANAVSGGSASLTFWEHNERVAAMRAIRGQPKPLPAKTVLYEPPPEDPWRMDLSEPRQAVNHRTLDPTRLWLPETMVHAATDAYANSVIRSGATCAEALVDFLYSPQAAMAQSPPGFAASPDSPWGLPKALARIPGGDMDGAKSIVEAFKIKSGQNGVSSTPARYCSPAPGSYDETTILEPLLDNSSPDVWEDARQIRDRVRHRVEMEQNANTNSGRPYLLDETDVFDLEGRAYRKRAEAAEPWNRPVLFEYYMLGPQGAWRSLATVTLALLERKLQEEGGAMDDQWAVAGRKRGRRSQQMLLR